MTTMTTIDTITDEQIQGLRTAAASAGDERQMAVCIIALDEIDGAEWSADTSAWLADRGYDPNRPEICRAKARAECARVISDGEAMRD